MTDDGIRQTARWLNQFKLGGRPEPRIEALVTQTEELIDEVGRLRNLVRTAASDLKVHNPTAAEELVAQIDWTPTTPGL